MFRRCLPAFIFELTESDGPNDDQRELVPFELHPTDKAACMELDSEDTPMEERCDGGLGAANNTAKSFSSR